MTLAFLTPQALWLLPLALLPLLPRRQTAVPLSSLEPLQRLRPTWRIRLQRTSPWLASTILLLLILLLAQPVQRRTTQATVREGVDLMLVLDVSASLRARDILPDRMSAARTAAAEFLAQRRDDRIGVILFSGVPVLLSPPVLDKRPLIARLQAAEADRSGTGTAIGDALAAALARLKDSPARSKAVVLLTDGNSNRGRITPRAATRAAAALGIRVYTIGFGSEAGGEVPLGPDGTPARLADGTILRSTLDAAPLEEMARLTGGQYFRAASGDALRDIYRRIDALEKSPLETQEFVANRPLVPWLHAWLALLLTGELILFRLWLRIRPTGYLPDVATAAALLLLLGPTAPESAGSTTPAQGPALALAVDLSASMRGTDTLPSRIEQGRRELRTLVSALPNARFSLTLFGGEGMIQSPLTEDRDAILFFLDHLAPGILASPGSAPEEGVLTALQTLAAASGERGVVLVSDGERTVPANPPRLPGGIPVYVLPTGSSGGTPVLDGDGLPRLTPQREKIFSKLDLERLRLIAATTGGSVLQGGEGAPAVVSLIDRWRPAERGVLPTRWWLWGALLLLALRGAPWPRPWTAKRLAFPALGLTVAIAAAACGSQIDDGNRAFDQGLSEAKAGAYAAAAASFARAAESVTETERGVALYNQGTALLAAEEAEAALPVLEQALILLPGDSAVRTNLVLALRALGETPPSGVGDGARNQGGEGEGEMNREQALQLVEAVKPQAFAATASDDLIRERGVERDW